MNDEYKYYPDLKTRFVRISTGISSAAIYKEYLDDGGVWRFQSGSYNGDMLSYVENLDDWLNDKTLMTHEEFLARTSKLGRILYD